ncbi:MAG: hypothetical protein RBT84_11115 [FCB group bacterium]|nr:hypothetical protein [FCB group bacterium]
MSTVFLLPLALTLLSGVQEAPIWLDQFGLGAEEFLSRASQMGLKEESIRDVMTEIDRSGPPCAASLTKLAESWRAEGVDLFAFLRQLVEDDVLPEARHGRFGRGITWVKVLGALADVNNVGMSDWVLCYARDRLTERFKAGIRSRDDDRCISDLLWVLGRTKRNEAIEFLLKVQSDSFWNSEEAPKIDMEPLLGGEITSEMENVRVVDAIREGAIQAMAESGTERAIEILATGEQIASELHTIGYLDGYFGLAVRRHVGLHEFIPREKYGVELPAETLAEIKRIYAKYGKTYVPVKENKDLQEWIFDYE